jgi:hypothetical protein
MPPNREQSGVYVGAIIAAIGVLMILLPSLREMDMMRGGYALQFIGIFVLLAGLATTWFLRGRAQVMARMLAGDNLLAHWTYPTAQARQHAAEVFADTRDQNRGVFIITSILIVVIGVPVLVVPLWRDLVEWRDPIALAIVGGYFAIIPLLGLFAWGMPRLAYRRALQGGGAAYIARDGVFVNGALHTWQMPFGHLKKVRYDQESNIPALEFDIRNLTRLGVIHYASTIVRVPVPHEEEQQAENVVRFFGERDNR